MAASLVTDTLLNRISPQLIQNIEDTQEKRTPHIQLSDSDALMRDQIAPKLTLLSLALLEGVSLTDTTHITINTAYLIDLFSDLLLTALIHLHYPIDLRSSAIPEADYAPSLLTETLDPGSLGE